MVNKIKLKACPFCATRAIWYKGDKNTRMPDRVQCLGCCVEIEGDYEPMSAIDSWNSRASDHYISQNDYFIDIGSENL